MQVQEDTTTNLTGGTSETLKKQLVEASLTDLEAVVQNPLITWLWKCLAAKLESFLPH